MKTTAFRNSKFDHPTHIFGGWHVTQWPPVGEERVHGPYSTREAARHARAKMIETTGSDRHAAERAFRRA